MAEIIDWCFTEERRQECLNQIFYRLAKAKEFADVAKQPGPPTDVREDELLATTIFGAAGSAEACKRSWDSDATFGMSQKGDNLSRECEDCNWVQHREEQHLDQRADTMGRSLTHVLGAHRKNDISRTMQRTIQSGNFVAQPFIYPE